MGRQKKPYSLLLWIQIKLSMCRPWRRVGKCSCSPPIINCGLKWGKWSALRSGRFTPGERVPGTDCIRGRASPKAGLDILEKEISSELRIELLFFRLPALSLVQYPCCSLFVVLVQKVVVFVTRDPGYLSQATCHWVTACTLQFHVRQRGSVLLLFLSRLDRLRLRPSLLFSVYRGLFPRRPRHKADHRHLLQCRG
jgi:hypothetical protein